jgi:hypothetical protein
MQRRVYKNLLLIAVSIVLIGAWWLSFMYAMESLPLLPGLAVVSVTTFAMCVSLAAVEIARSDSRLVIRQFLTRKLLMSAGIRSLVASFLLVVFTELRFDANSAKLLLWIALLGTVIVVIKRKRTARDRAGTVVCAAAGAIFYLGITDALPYGVEIGLALFAFAILLLIFLPGTKHLNRDEASLNH